MRKRRSFIQKFNVNPSGNWEEGANILYQQSDTATNDKLEQARQKLLTARASRTRPARAEQVITSWNAMMIQGLVDAYRALGEMQYLTLPCATLGSLPSTCNRARNFITAIAKDKWEHQVIWKIMLG